MANQSGRRRVGWRAAQTTSVMVVLAVVGLLLAWPELGLFITWNLLVPGVPALLLVAPQVWRNLCPIAVVHQLPVALGRGGSRRFSARAQRGAPVMAAALFFIIVPLRLSLFDQNGPALAAFVLAVLAIALASGLLYFGKSGWCITFCPMLPVERLYGQRPILPVEHAHCDTCSGCIRSCYDLKPEGPLDALIEPASRLRKRGPNDPANSILHTTNGLFAAGFPGFVLGYFTHTEGLGIGLTYLRLALFCATSIVLWGAIQSMLRMRGRVLVKCAAAAGAGLFYWFTVPSVAQAAHQLLDIPDAPSLGINAVRAALLTLAAVWLVAALRSRGSGPSAPRLDRKA